MLGPNKEKCPSHQKNPSGNGTRKTEKNLKRKTMSSRASILEKVKQNQPSTVSELPNLTFLGLDTFDILENYKTVLKGIGGDFMEVKDYDAIIDFVKKNYATEKRIISTIPDLTEIASTDWYNDDPHTLEDVELTVVKAHF